MAELRQRYLYAVRDLLGLHLHDQLSPSMLAGASVAVLPVDGAGVSMSDPRLRVPCVVEQRGCGYDRAVADHVG